jgi:hypothetical protein
MFESTYGSLFLLARSLRGDEGAMHALQQIDPGLVVFVEIVRTVQRAPNDVYTAHWTRFAHERPELAGVLALMHWVDDNGQISRLAPSWAKSCAAQVSDGQPLARALAVALRPPNAHAREQTTAILFEKAPALAALVNAYHGDAGALDWLARQPREERIVTDIRARRTAGRDAAGTPWEAEATDRAPRVAAAKSMGAGVRLAETIARESSTEGEARALAEQRVAALIRQLQPQLEAAISLGKTDPLAAYRRIEPLYQEATESLCADEPPRPKGMAARSNDIVSPPLIRQSYDLYARCMAAWQDLHARSQGQRAEQAAAARRVPTWGEQVVAHFATVRANAVAEFKTRPQGKIIVAACLFLVVVRCTNAQRYVGDMIVAQQSAIGAAIDQNTAEVKAQMRVDADVRGGSDDTEHSAGWPVGSRVRVQHVSSAALEMMDLATHRWWMRAVVEEPGASTRCTVVKQDLTTADLNDVPESHQRGWWAGYFDCEGADQPVHIRAAQVVAL